MEQLVTANIMLDLFSMVLSLIPLVYALNNRRYRRRLDKCFLGVSLSNIFMIIGDLSDWLIRAPDTPFLRVVLNFFSVEFYIASACVLYFCARYVDEYLTLTGRWHRYYLFSVYLVCGVHVLLALLSPFTGAFFTVTEEGYQRGPLFFLSQLAPLYCYLSFGFLVLAFRRRLSLREQVFFFFYVFVPVLCGVAQLLLPGIAVVNISVTLSMLFMLVNIQFEHEIVLHKQEQELAQLNMDVMLSQIQPHFLYNSLATISHLCKRDPVEAQRAIQDFSAFLRGNMESLKKRSPVPFEQELNHVRHYLYLEQRRFQARLRVVYDIQATDFLVPALSLQPLAENSVRHGILKKEEGGVVTILSREEKDCFLVQVIDNGVGFRCAGQQADLGDHCHIGIENVRGRLESMVCGILDIESSDSGTVVSIHIPKKNQSDLGG